MSDTRFSLRNLIGLLACRILVPAWIAAGAATKLYTVDPGLLPRNTILPFAHNRGIDIYLLLSILISVEFIAVCIMFFLARFAKAVAIALLGTFCVILIIEIMSGAKSCGCLGRFSPPPWQMLTADAILLALVLIGRSVPLSFERGRRLPWILAALGSIVLTIVTFARIMPEPEPAFVHAPGPAQTARSIPEPGPHERFALQPAAARTPRLLPPSPTEISAHDRV